MNCTLVSADLHVSANQRDAYRWLFLEETLPALIKEHRATRLIICGDLTEAKSGHEAAFVNRLVDALAALAEIASVYILKGNHDYQAEDTPFFRFLRHLPRVRWINEPTRLKLRGLGDCMFFPHTSNWAETWVAAGGPIMHPDYYFVHQTFDGAVGENRRPLGGVGREIFPHGTRIVSGDVHVPQKLGCVTYVGAPTTIKFGDSFEPRVLLLEGNKMRSVPVPGPQKRQIVLSGRDPLAHLNDYKHSLIAGVVEMSPGDVVSVRVELPPETKLSRADVRARVRGWADDLGVNLYATEIIAPKASSTRPARDRHRASDADLVRGYAKKMGQGKAAVAAGLKLMEETP